MGDIKRLLRKWLVLAAVAAAGAAGLAMLFRVELADFLDMGRTAPVLIMAAVFPALFCMPLLGGAVQGLQLFVWRSVGMSLGAISRVALGAGFVWFLYPACGWAMLGHGLGVYVSAVVLSLALLLTLRGSATTGKPLPSMRFYLFQSFFIQAAYAVLMTADVVLVSHHLPEDVEFAKAATIGRLVVFLPGAIAIAMFPKVTSGGSTTDAQRTVFLRSLGYTALCVSGGVLVCWFAGGLVAQVLGVPQPSDYLKKMIGLMGTAMGFSAMLNVLLQFLLAQRRFGPAFPIIVFAAGYLAATSFFHGSAWQIGMAAAISNAAALVALLLFLWKKNWFAEQKA